MSTTEKVGVKGLRLAMKTEKTHPYRTGTAVVWIAESSQKEDFITHNVPSYPKQTLCVWTHAGVQRTPAKRAGWRLIHELWSRHHFSRNRKDYFCQMQF